jgi:hypothetical protein
MTKKEAKGWLDAFKKAKFKCIAPQQVVEAMEVLGMTKKDIKPKLFSLDISNKFIKEFNSLGAPGQYKVLGIMKDLMTDPYQGQVDKKTKIDSPISLENIIAATKPPKSDYN